MYRKRYVATAITLFAIGVVFAVCMKEYDTWFYRNLFFVIAALSVMLTMYFSHQKDAKHTKIITAVAFAVAAFSIGVTVVCFNNRQSSMNGAYNGQTDVAILSVDEINNNYINASIVSSKIGVAKGESIHLYVNGDITALYIGDNIMAKIKYKYVDKNSYRADSISLTASGSIEEIYAGSGLFYEIRKSISENSSKLFAHSNSGGAISKAIIIGDRSELDTHIFSIYRSAGISHILAISGLHISIITMCIFNVLAVFRINRKISCVIASCASIIYAALVGFTVGAVRSSVMISMALLMNVFFRNADRFTSIFIALFLLLITNPYSICSSGLQLSFLCTLGILMFEPLIEKCGSLFVSRLRRTKGLLLIMCKTIIFISSIFVTTIAATLFSFPVLYFSFDTVSYISPLTNIVAIPLFTIAIWFIFAAFAIAPFSITIAAFVAFPAGYLFDLVTEFTETIFMSKVGVASVYSNSMFMPLILSVAFIIYILFRPTNNFKVHLCFMLIFALSVIIAALYNERIHNDKAILECGVNESDYVYISYENKNAYIDLGGYTSATDSVYKNGFTYLDSYIILEYSQSSFERLEYLISDMPVNTLIIPYGENLRDVKFISQIKELANQINCDILFYDNCKLELSDDCVIEIVKDLNNENGAIVSAIIHGSRICVVGDDYDNSVVCDIAIVLNDYKDSESRVIANTAYILKENTSYFENQDLTYQTFEDSLRIEIDISERDFIAYEP